MQNRLMSINNLISAFTAALAMSVSITALFAMNLDQAQPGSWEEQPSLRVRQRGMGGGRGGGGGLGGAGEVGSSEGESGRRRGRP